MTDRFVEKISAFHTYSSACTTTVSVETNGPRGGDAGHGGYIAIEFNDDAGTHMEVALNGGAAEEVRSFRFIFSGDSEMEALEECLQFALLKIKQLREINADPFRQAVD